jgi:hypothetical protein
MHECSEKCAGDSDTASCVAECLQEQGMTAACSRCFSANFSCDVSACPICASGSPDDCGRCVEKSDEAQRCNGELKRCTGWSFG